MPRIVIYVDRFEGIREAVYRITLRDGVDAINLAAVATELQMSSRTIQRLVSSTEALPFLGLQWAERLARYRFTRERRLRTDEPQCASALDELLAILPGNPAIEEQHVWWPLATTFDPTFEWARDARAAGEGTLARLCERVIEEAAIDDSGHECRRLRLLAAGAVTELVRSRIQYEEVAEVLREHVRQVAAYHWSEPGAAAGAQGPSAA
jgi:AraC-like DNA-binding protein